MRACHAPDPASPTAVGKTAVGLLLAERLGGEVISADSVQVYCGLDVGSDKLPVAQRRGVPHHLIDIRDVGQDYSAGDFSDEANAAIQDILAGKPKGPRTSPEALAAVRAKVLQVWRTASAAASAQAGCTTPTQDTQPSPTTAAGAVAAATAAQEPAAGLSPQGGGGASSPGPRAGQSPLQHVEVEGLDAAAKWQLACGLLGQAGDPVTQQRVLGERNNYYRLERALVLLHLTGGTPLADLDWASSSGSDSEGGEETSTGAGPDGMGQQRAVQWRPFFLHRPRLALYSRIEGRVEEMVLGGLVQEAAQLLLGGHGPDSSAATRAIGYKQAMDWLLHLVLEQRATGAYTGKQEECQEGCANPLPQPLAHTKTSSATLQPPQQLWPPAQQEVTQQGRGEGQQQPGLTSQGPLAAGDPPGRCWSVGVREVEALVRAVCAATHKLVRHQMTWFRDSSEYKWLDMDALGNTEAAVDAILQELALPQHQGGCAPGSGRLEADEARSLRQRPLALSSTQGGGEAVVLQLHLINSQLLPRLAADEGVRRMVEARAALQQRQAEEAEAREQAKQARRRQVALEHKARHRQQANQPAGVGLKEGQG
ncbi:hypothetical protein V8C86DRAFT_848417 [Haematococcus lacustris]